MSINNIVLSRNTGQTIQPQLTLTAGPKSLHPQPTQPVHGKQRTEAMTATTGVLLLIKHKISKAHHKKCCYFGDTRIFTKSVGYSFWRETTNIVADQIPSIPFPKCFDCSLTHPLYSLHFFLREFSPKILLIHFRICIWHRKQLDSKLTRNGKWKAWLLHTRVQICS